MTLGTPRMSAPAGSGIAAPALSSAALALGGTALSIAAVLVVLRNVNSPGYDSWLAMALLVVLAAGMALTHRLRVLPVMIGYLLVGAASIGVYSWIILENSPPDIAESPFILALPQIAFVYTISPTIAGLRALVFIGSAYLLGQLAVLGAAVQADRYPTFDYSTALSTLVILVVCAAGLALARRTELDHRAVSRARREADAATYQQELESQVVALFHDTVLSELTQLARQTPGPLGAEQAAALRRDLSMIAEGAWWPETAAGDIRNHRSALPPAIAAALDEARRDGLTVDLSGDLSALHRLRGPVASALGQALGQALVNVRQHSGVDRAELVIDDAPDAVVVMLSDAGRGFDEAGVPADRFGVTRSIRGRIRDAGGDTRLWTSPGNGTAYMFTLPVPAPADGGGA